MGQSEVPNSICLNSPIPRLWPFAAGRGFSTRLVERFKLGWWLGDSLLASKKPKLRMLFKDSRFAYAAPLRNSEATRCREVLETIQCPFVVHLWDIMDRPLNVDYAWLFSHAERVFCLSEPMLMLVRETVQCEPCLLSFVRPPAKFRASFRGGNSISIGLVGFLAPYRDGLDLLAKAIESFRTNDMRITVRYIGPSSQLEFIPASLKECTEHVGFLMGDDLDQALKECDFGFLPGPLLPPDRDQRSRYSVPSRSADYMAVGLPLVAAVHPNSATSFFASTLRGRGFFPVNDSGSLLGAIKMLRDEKTWSDASAECLSFFHQRCEAGVALKEFNAIARRFLEGKAPSEF